MIFPVSAPGLVRLLLLLLCIAGPVHAVETHLGVPLPGAPDFQIERFGNDGAPLLLWLPSERGLGKAQREHARKLAELGYEVWLADLHDYYFIERNRRSIGRFPLEDVVALIDASARASAEPVVLLSSSRGAQLALIAAREWQLRNRSRARLAGLVLAHAHLYEARPAAGEKADYLPITSATNLPVFLLEARYSTKTARLDELARVIESGGSRVYTQIIADVQGGFFARDESELSAADRAAKENYALTLKRAVELLKLNPPPASAASVAFDTRRFSRFGVRDSKLTELAQPLTAPGLQLRDLEAREYVLQKRRGRVVLVNFWASWCRPCVEEIPSLHRLGQQIDSPDFEILTVNVGETRERIEDFLARVPIELPLLMDFESRAARDWRVYVYPSSFLVDQSGQIRYAYLGALEWDSTANITIIQNLLRQP